MSNIGSSLNLIPLESLYTHVSSSQSETDDAAERVSAETIRSTRADLPIARCISDEVRASLFIDSPEALGTQTRPSVRGPKSFKALAKRHWHSIVDTRLPKGWRFGATLAALMVSCILTINITVAIFAWVWTSHRGYKSNIAPLYTGDCTAVNNLGLGVHFGINIVSTLLLGASNYCMQIVCAPTRKDIDKAHEKGSWLQIGVQSISNLRHIKKAKLYTWLTLGLSSVPLHLIYNSTFFTSLGINAYDVYFAIEGFENGDAYDWHLFADRFFTSYTHPEDSYRDVFKKGNTAGTYITNPTIIQKHATGFERLENSDCMQKYGVDFVSDRRNLILVVAKGVERTMSWNNTDVGGPGQQNDVYHEESCGNKEADTDLASIPLGHMSLSCNRSLSLLAVGTYANEVIVTFGNNRPDAYYWICSHDRYTSKDMCSSHLSDLRANARSWKVYGMPIEYCLSERVEPQCSLNVTLTLLTVIIIFNLIKVYTIALMVLRIKDKPLITLGDAISSFIDQPDATTTGLCLVNKSIVESHHWKKQREVLINHADKYKTEHIRWYKAASKRRWLSCFFMIATSVSVILALFAYAVSDLHRRGDSNARALWNLGLGKIHASTLIQGWAIPMTGDSAVTGTVLIANLPQALLSFIYLVFNGLCTNMMIAFEWSKFAKGLRTLRVSEPRGAQRQAF